MLTIDYFKDGSTALLTTDTFDHIIELGTIWLQWRISEQLANELRANKLEARFQAELNDYMALTNINKDVRFDVQTDDNSYENI